MKKLILIFAYVLFLSRIAYSQEILPFSDLDIFELQYVSEPTISPDGQQVVYIRNQFDIMTDRKYSNIWSCTFNGDNHMPLTSGKSNMSSPKWSPDGERIAYVMSEDNGTSQIYIRWTNRGHVASISNLSGRPMNLKWSPDGRQISFSMFIESPMPKLGTFPQAPEGAKWAAPGRIIDQLKFRSEGNFGFEKYGYQQLFIISSEGGTVKQLTFDPFNHNNSLWSPDGKYLIFSANREEDAELNPQNTQIYELELSTLIIRRISSGKGPHNQPEISPNGNWIAYTGFDDRHVGYQLSHLYIMDRNGQNKKQIPHMLDADCKQLEWAGDSKSIFALFEKHGMGHIANIALDGSVIKLNANIGGTSYGRPYSSGSYSIAKNGNYVFTLSSPDQPAELAAAQFKQQAAPKRISGLNDLFLSSRKTGKVEEVWFHSRADSLNVQGWIVYPPEFDSTKKYPLILEIHGGPYLAYGPHFSPEIQLMASRGYVVLYTNPRGSTSYGEKFASYINHNYPSQDYDDLMSGIDHVLLKGFIDEKRLFITGGSGGGVLTAWSIGKTHRFAAAVISKPVINWFTLMLTSDFGPAVSGYWFNKKPWEDPHQYFTRSPISLVSNVNTPAMLVCGEQDFRTPIAESEQYYAALKMRKIPTMLVRIPEASHNITARPSNLIRHVSYITGWFDRYHDRFSDHYDGSW